MKKQSILFAILICVVISATAQFHGGAKVGYSLFPGPGFGTLIFGGNLELERNESLGIRGSFDIGSGQIKDEVYSAHASSSATVPQSIDVTGTTKIQTFHLGLDGRKFFGTSEFETGGFYGFLGVGLTVASAQSTYEFGIYSKTEYSVTGFADEEAKNWYSQYMLRGGAGYEFNLDVVKVFLEGKLNFPANSVSGIPIPVDIGPNLGIATGVRF